MAALRVVNIFNWVKQSDFIAYIICKVWLTMNMDSDVSIRESFDLYEKEFEQLENSPLNTSSAEFQARLAKLVQNFENLSRAINSLGIFSMNESLDDLSTVNMRFLLLDYFLSETTLKLITPNRLELLKKCKAYLQHFFFLCEQYGILEEEEKRTIECTNKEFKPTLEIRRNIKISRYKKEKEWKQKIIDTKAFLEKELNEKGEDSMEERSRELTIYLIHYYIQKGSESIETILMEEDMLERMQSMTEKEKMNFPPAQTIRRNPNPNEPLLSSSGKPNRPFVLLGQHEALRKQVFQMGHRLPTMTVDEYLQKQIEQGNFLSGGTQAKKEIDEDNIKEVDAATIKARKWDDFTDENPRGWGNKGGNIG